MRKARRVYGRFTAPTLCVAVLLAGAVSAQANDRAVDDAFWNTVKSCRDADEVRMYLSHFPGGRHVAKARACLKKLQLADDRAVTDDAFWNTVKSCAAHEAAGRLEAALDCLKKLQLADDAFWNAVKSCTNVDEVRVYLEKFPKGRHVAEARACLKKLELSYLSTAERQGDPSKPRQSSPFAVRVLITYCIF